ncbi:hypothetical protein LRR81_08810 [Metabacillus sp. GX 13764]|uniref:hypothetical protein n=1 Tax=Metabacillus kandeliae TaxID=2900151 RepID=UPI001E610EA7|nr:hypothetical protein [Metabacillus kandeliae]MCD7034334.1 hypothetical protein [Metabacillus kandeliae]
MAHVRPNCKNPSTSISWDENILSMVDDFRFENRIDNRSAAVQKLVRMGLKYQALLEKKRERELARG